MRALGLAHALQHQHLLPANARVAMIGGGAAGTTAAAALALQGGTNVHLFEKAHQLLPLQGDTQRRRLDPYIYDWPNPDSEHELAQLPILDWCSGAAVDVREAVLREFGEVACATQRRLTINVRHAVTGIASHAGRFIVSFERDAPDGERQAASQEFDIVVLAIGFGIEPQFAIPHTQTASYWRDASVPGAEINGNPRPTFLVSGNGDGGLIDLIASASATFRHDDIVRGIAQRAGVQALRDALLAIDALALAAERNGQGFNFIAAYDQAIGNQVEALGLVDEMQGRLRPGVQLFLQTREPELLTIKTARLNRLAIYLLKKACARPIAENFTHVVCDDVILIPSLPEDGEGSRRFQCGATIVRADWVIARRGPSRDPVRQPFAELLAGYPAEHGVWLQQFPIDSIAPRLNPATHNHFTQLATRAKLPPPRYDLPAATAAMPRRGKLWLIGGAARWSGDVLLEDVATLWSDGNSQFELTVIDSPDQLGSNLAHAVARMAIHAPRANLLVDVARWSPFLAALSSESPSAGGLQRPLLSALGGHPSILNPVTMSPNDLAAEINRSLDRWLLNAVHHHLTRYIERGEDPGRAVSFVAAADLRQQMGPIWDDWIQRFEGNPTLLARFFGLAICSKDEPAAAGEASTLAGRRFAPEIARACAVALAVATAWQVTAPRSVHPGNLARDANGTDRSGHTCAAGFIDGEEMALVALRHAWSTEFVLLPMQAVPPTMIADANRSLGKSDDGTMLLGQGGAAGKLILTVDSDFRRAASTSAAALRDLLLGIEERHFARLRAEIQSAGALA
ncbi:MAG: ABC-three component system protein [Gammaproteobacteria bacterium]